MSLGIVIKGPEGLVLAAESRVTLGTKMDTGETAFSTFDNATKILTFTEPHQYIGVVTWGQASIGLRTASSFVPEIQVPDKRLPVDNFARKLSDFFAKQWNAEYHGKQYAGPNMIFIVAGFDEGDPYGRVFQFEIPGIPNPFEQHATQNGNVGFGLTWGGQREFVDRLMQGYDPKLLDLTRGSLGLDDQQMAKLKQDLLPLHMQVPISFMALQDYINLALFFIRTTINGQDLTVGLRGVGGPIDVAVITRKDGLKFVQRKQLTGKT